MNLHAEIENMRDLTKKMKEDATDLVNFDLDNQIAEMEERLNYVVNNIVIRKGTEFLMMNALNFEKQPSDYYFEVKEVNKDTFKVLVEFKRKAEYE
ncbi:hypothetical protein AF306_15455 [Listeria monocytogenes]|nr:hypothetical protein [Listeria monocytogenes]EAD8590520.1 hypothetical protein [Listeria monocytogenes]EAD8593642.1 hypothetical protein [Listeria monocytogenes]EAD8602599.1 hypothetical protein [Listeria monocytogenes]